ncbi:uracil-DNA glycosylase [Yoonia sp. 208BN28-4]|uniref:uracil-DNA glycosylase n=1 Tax=Yoonia sp. 208BN28-4 TaxID=3126505 RepID=UPI0030ABB612
MDSVDTYWADRALLEWQVELGVTDAVSDTPVDRYALEVAPPKPVAAAPPATPSRPAPPPIPQAETVDAAEVARTVAAAASDLTALNEAVANFPHCDLRQGARKAVFSDGSPSARVMVIGETPNRAEDRAGAPFVGEEGALLDKMLAAIGLARDAADPATAAYLLSPLPWRTPADDLPEPAHIAMLRPFLERHITLANPDVILLMGNTGLQMLTGQGGLTKRRGAWIDVLGRPALPTFHPAHLIRTPLAKREAWADLLQLKAKLKGTP